MSLRGRRLLVPALSAALAVTLARPSFAQQPATPPPATTAPATAAPDAPAASSAQEEARARFRRALELVDDGDFDAANLELLRAYELAPSYRILYNIGLVSQQLKEYARAYDAYERYLREGGAEVPADRVAEVTRRIERLKGRVAYLTVTSDPPGAEVFIDEVAAGRTPFEKPLRVNSGQRRVSVKVPGRQTDGRVVELAGGEQKTIQFDVRLGSTPATTQRSAVPYIAWGGTGLLTAAAVTTGILALTSTSHYDDVVNSKASSGADISSAWSRAHGFALSTDILIGAAVAAAGVSVYFTIRPPKSDPTKSASVTVLPGVVFGQF